MCGIAGFVGSGTLDDLKRMTDTLIHRGPDGEGLWSDAATRVHLGHRRLAILDLAGGQQPMWTADGRIGIVFNGEIYNFAELRRELEGHGHVFQTDHSDTEVLLYGYRQWGTALTERLNGMWAFVIYDRDRRLLFCSRDRFGKKPFFYTVQGGTLVFASELTALIAHPAVRATPCARAIRKYFAYGYIPAPLSLYEDIFKLPAGHSLTFSLVDGNLHRWQYWRFTLEAEPAVPADAESRWGEELRHLLSEAVRRRLVSDVPVGVFLSGGIDSSAVAACAVRLLGGGRVNTFSIGFEEASFDESAHAAAVARHLGTVHHPHVLSIDLARQLAPAICARLDEPMADSSLLPTYLLCGHARTRVTVALGGDGADELFAGYAPFRALRLARLYQRLVPRPMHSAITSLVATLPAGHAYLSLDFKLKRTLRGLNHEPRLWNAAWLAPLAPDEVAELLGGPMNVEDLFSEAIELWEANPQLNLTDQTLQFFTRLYLENDILTKVDRASMMHSLEVRAPFLDIDVVNFARRIPSDWKLRGGETKYLLKRALAPWLPREILHRTKQGFAVPIAKWFREGSLDMPSANNANVANPSFIAKKIDEHRAGRANHHAYLWSQRVLDTALARKQ